MTFAELERAMRARGWTWDGAGPDDPDSRFLKLDNPALGIAGALELLRGWEYPGEELRSEP